MAYIIGRGRYARETYPERPSGGSTGSDVFATGARANKGVTAADTVSDGDLACPVAVAVTPAASSTNGGYIGVRVNGVHVPLVGDGTTVGVWCYFSDDGGVTAKLMRDVVAGDLLYWNGSIAGYELEISDAIDFDYDVST